MGFFSAIFSGLGWALAFSSVSISSSDSSFTEEAFFSFRGDFFFFGDGFFIGDVVSLASFFICFLTEETIFLTGDSSTFLDLAGDFSSSSSLSMTAFFFLPVGVFLTGESSSLSMTPFFFLGEGFFTGLLSSSLSITAFFLLCFLFTLGDSFLIFSSLSSSNFSSLSSFNFLESSLADSLFLLKAGFLAVFLKGGRPSLSRDGCSTSGTFCVDEASLSLFARTLEFSLDSSSESESITPARFLVRVAELVS